MRRGNVTKFKLTVLVIYFVIISHIAIFMSVWVFLSMDGFTLEEMTTTIALITPLFVMYTIIAMGFLNRSRTKLSMRRSNNINFGFSVFIPPTLFALTIGLCIFFRSENMIFQNFDQFKITISVADTLFAIYAGLFVIALFNDD